MYFYTIHICITYYHLYTRHKQPQLTLQNLMKSIIIFPSPTEPYQKQIHFTPMSNHELPQLRAPCTYLCDSSKLLPPRCSVFTKTMNTIFAESIAGATPSRDFPDAAEAAALVSPRLGGTDPYLGLRSFTLLEHHLELGQGHVVLLDPPWRLRPLAGFGLFHITGLSLTVFHAATLPGVAVGLCAVTSGTLLLARGSSSPRGWRRGAAGPDLVPHLSAAAPDRFLPRLRSQHRILPLLLQHAQIPPRQVSGQVFCVLQRTRS